MCCNISLLASLNYSSVYHLFALYREEKYAKIFVNNHLLGNCWRGQSHVWICSGTWAPRQYTGSNDTPPKWRMLDETISILYESQFTLQKVEHYYFCNLYIYIYIILEFLFVLYCRIFIISAWTHYHIRNDFNDYFKQLSIFDIVTSTVI